jgi:Protein of unknown function (DUF3140)
MAGDNAAIWKEFRDTVNMKAGELEKWLRTDESKSVGQKGGNGESTATPAVDESSAYCGPRNRI